MLNAQSSVVPFQDFAVADMYLEIAHLQATHNFIYDCWHLCIKMQGNLINVDHVNITLIELAKSSLLWSLTSPCPLYLVAFEWENEIMQMFCHIACQGNRQIVVEAQAWIARFVIRLQAL